MLCVQFLSLVHTIQILLVVVIFIQWFIIVIIYIIILTDNSWGTCL
jgi:hypothetical protein